jgi:uncharacterized protein (TIGR03435 family)
MRKELSTVAAFLFAMSICAQNMPAGKSGSPHKPSFEVASVKQCPSESRPDIAASPDRLSMTCWPLRRMIEDAYDVYPSGQFDARYPLNYTPIEGMPEWVGPARYTIAAKAAEPQTRYMMRGPMMQALLEERFHLKIRSETCEVPAYLLTVAKGGSKLTATKPGSCTVLDPTDPDRKMTPEMPYCIVMPPVHKGSRYVWDVRGITLDVVAKLLMLDLPTIDRTGLTGPFDIHLEWTYEESSSFLPDGSKIADPTRNTLIEAYRNQLGLEFVRGKGLRKYLVIEHIERPSEN